jgi:hypothetical protein
LTGVRWADRIKGVTAMGSDREGGVGVAIRAVEVRKVYGTKDAQVEALRGIDARIAAGGI